jgi:predicted ATP-binding protein involved in virulence
MIFQSELLLEDNNSLDLFKTENDRKPIATFEKGFITLIGDIARRLAIANPESKNPLLGEGIILIDEIELHLHPSWQIEIISQLRSTFPNCQFIVTTHSPLVISSIKDFDDEKLFPLQNGNIINHTEAPYGKQVQDLLRSIFDLKTVRNIEVQEKFDLLDILFSENRWNIEEKLS